MYDNPAFSLPDSDPLAFAPAAPGDKGFGIHRSKRTDLIEFALPAAAFAIQLSPGHASSHPVTGQQFVPVQGPVESCRPTGKDIGRESGNIPNMMFKGNAKLPEEPCRFKFPQGSRKNRARRDNIINMDDLEGRGIRIQNKCHVLIEAREDRAAFPGFGGQPYKAGAVVNLDLYRIYGNFIRCHENPDILDTAHHALFIGIRCNF